MGSLRTLWNQLNLGKCLPLNWLLLCFIAIAALVTIFSSPFPSLSSLSSANSSRNDVYRNYRRLWEQTASDLREIPNKIQSLSQGISQLKEFEFCGKERENFVPCYNVSANLQAGFSDGDEFDRHCEVDQGLPSCLVRAPKDYKIPLPWPAGRDVIWSGNVKITKDQFLSSGSMTKRLMLLEENQIAFYSEDGANFDSVKDYSRRIAEMIGLESDSEFLQAGVRTVLDIGCGFGSFGAHLFSLKLMTFCIAGYEIFGSQVQLALERGLPAVVGSFNARRLPFPSLSFDMIHCAQCGIIWDSKAGSSLIEVDRLLKPGGYFVLTSLTSRTHGSSVRGKKGNAFTTIEDFAPNICWSLLRQQEETFIWQKTADINCYTSRKHGEIPLCKDDDEEGSYYLPLRSCISGTASKRWFPIQNSSHWSTDSQLILEELSIHGLHPDEYFEDSLAWEEDLKNYWSLLTPLIFSDHPKRPGEEDPLPPFNMVRNVMDMNARYGGLNAALVEAGKSVWVMNVVPSDIWNTLPLILDRGFIGVLHNWCEPFPTYPRTYDMLHAIGLLSRHLTADKCSLSYLLLEMDRILRPEGWVILRDTTIVIEKARALVTQLRWDARVIELQTDNDQRLLVCQKPFLKK